MEQERRLSLTTRHYICTLLRQLSNNESAALVAFKAKVSVDNCTRLNQILREQYTQEAELLQVIIQLENLVFFHKTLSTEPELYPDRPAQLIRAKQQIFQLLGFRES